MRRGGPGGAGRAPGRGAPCLEWSTRCQLVSAARRPFRRRPGELRPAGSSAVLPPLPLRPGSPRSGLPPAPSSPRPRSDGRRSGIQKQRLLARGGLTRVRAPMAPLPLASCTRGEPAELSRDARLSHLLQSSAISPPLPCRNVTGGGRAEPPRSLLAEGNPPLTRLRGRQRAPSEGLSGGRGTPLGARPGRVNTSKRFLAAPAAFLPCAPSLPARDGDTGALRTGLPPLGAVPPCAGQGNRDLGLGERHSGLGKRVLGLAEQIAPTYNDLISHSSKLPSLSFIVFVFNRCNPRVLSPALVRAPAPNAGQRRAPERCCRALWSG